MGLGIQIQVVWEKARIKRLLRKVAALEKNKNRVVTDATRSGMRIVARQIQRMIPAYVPYAGESESDYRATRKAVGSRAGVSRGMNNQGPRGTVFGKAGSKVGKKRQNPRSLTRAGRSRPGVGTGAASLHWYLAGTNDRFHRSGHWTGRMRRVNVVSRAWRATQGLVYNKMRTQLWRNIRREAAKP